MNAESNYQLATYCDSDWVSCPNTKLSISGYFISLGSTPLSWKSKKQHAIAFSSTEAEYKSTRRIYTELAWLIRLLHGLAVPNVTPIPLKCDNQAANYIAKNPVFH